MNRTGGGLLVPHKRTTSTFFLVDYSSFDVGPVYLVMMVPSCSKLLLEQQVMKSFVSVALRCASSANSWYAIPKRGGIVVCLISQASMARFLSVVELQNLD